jgi:hypothetical protein
MDFKDLANKILNEGAETPKTKKTDSVESILESLDQKMNEEPSSDSSSHSDSDMAEKKFKKDAKKAAAYVKSDPNELVVDMGKGMKAPKNVNESAPKHLGKLNYIPNPLEYPIGTTFKNVNEGTVYIRAEGENLWESFVSDGKPGKNAYPSGGGGLGLRDVNATIAAATGGVSVYVSGATSGTLFTNNLIVNNIIYQTTITSSSIQLDPTYDNQVVINASAVTIKLPNPPITGLEYTFFNRNFAYTLSAAQSIYYNGTVANTQPIVSGTNILFCAYDGLVWAAK